MSTHPREVIAAVDGGLALNEAALKQTAVLFNRIALPGLTGLRNAPAPPQQPSITAHLAWLADAGIVFEPDIKPTEDQGLKNQILKDLDGLYQPIGVTGEEFLASRKDKQKALEIKSKIQDMETSGAIDPVRMFAIMQRMSVNTTRFLAIGLRNFHNMDAHVIVPAEISPFEHDDDDRPNKQDVLKITIAALPLPDKDVSWQQILEYRNDSDFFSRFLDLRNWIKETARGELTFAEVEEKLGAVLKRFRKLMDSYQLKIVPTAFEAFVTTNSEALHNLFSFHGSTSIIGASCSVEQRKLALFENEAPAEGGEVAYVLDTASLFAE